MQKFEVVIKEELFEVLGISVGKCSAYTDEADCYVRVNGDLYCKDKWDERFYLKVKANLCNKDDEIVQVDYDFDRKTFLKIGYESFSVCCYKRSDNLKYVEIYPKIVKVSEDD